MRFKSNGINEIFFVDGAEHSLSKAHCDALTSASAHFLEGFRITTEVDVYISQRSILQTIGNDTRAWHMPPKFDRNNSIVCVFVDPGAGIKDMIKLLAHEMIHAWQVDRGDLVGNSWKGIELGHLPYNLLPWEIEAWGNMESVAETFYESRKPTKTELDKIREDTETVFGEYEKDLNIAHYKKQAMKVAKVAGALGLGALIGI